MTKFLIFVFLFYLLFNLGAPKGEDALQYGKTILKHRHQEKIQRNKSSAGGLRSLASLYKRIQSLRAGLNTKTKKNDDTFLRFKFYKNGRLTYESSDEEKLTIRSSGCKSADKFAFILHGWRQSCNTEWVLKLIERLTYHRGGCIVCIDYSVMAEGSYMWLYRSFRVIRNSIVEQMLALINDGFNPKKGYMFGFSFGGQLATSIGRVLSPNHEFRNIDTCDMAGPGFDLISDLDHREAAENVQCFHSSRDKGTRVYACHQNILLGTCGFSQPAAASQPYYSSHGLCVQIYINAFDYPFYALQDTPDGCISGDPATNVPYGYTVGYTEDKITNITGEIYVPTSVNFPYNLSQKELKALSLLR